MLSTGDLYRRIMGPAFDQLPSELRDMHTIGERLDSAGRCDVRTGKNPLCRLIARLFGFPGAGDDLPVRVEMRRSSQAEVWTRHMGPDRFESSLAQGRGRYSGLLTEQFGVFKFSLELIGDVHGLTMELRGVRYRAIPLPRWFWPRAEAREFAADGRFHFDVRIELPLLGLMTHYAGWLEPQD